MFRRNFGFKPVFGFKPRFQTLVLTKDKVSFYYLHASHASDARLF